MKDFRFFDVYDFVMDEDFIRWVKEKRKSDNDFWNSWLAKHPGKHIVVEEARRILESLSIMLGTDVKNIPDTEKEEESERLLKTIMTQPEQKIPPQSAPVRKLKRWWYAVAAAVLIGVCGILFFTTQKNVPSEISSFETSVVSKQLIENINTSGKPVTVNLPDGSTVQLGADSKIGYANNFDSADTRDIYLSGEAFFSVTKNPNRPFRVFANEIVTKVLGTSFNIRSFEKDSIIQVTVRTGKVSVYSKNTVNIKKTISDNHLGGIILTPNQELVYQKSKQKFQKILLDNPIMVLPAIMDKSLVYEEASLEKVFDQLGKNYGISIIYDNESLNKCTITADLRNVAFYDKLDLICRALGARYEVIDGQVVIQANGCY